MSGFYQHNVFKVHHHSVYLDCFLFMAEQYSIVLINHMLFIHSQDMDSWLFLPFEYNAQRCHEHLCTRFCLNEQHMFYISYGCWGCSSYSPECCLLAPILACFTYSLPHPVPTGFYIYIFWYVMGVAIFISSILALCASTKLELIETFLHFLKNVHLHLTSVFSFSVLVTDKY